MASKTNPAFESIAAMTPAAIGEERADLKHVQDFLNRFGYLNDGSYEASRLDDETSKALTSFQERAGLTASGEFDEPTRAQMTTHRCGMADLSSGLEFSARCSWPNPNLTYAFDTGTNDTPGTGEFQAVRNAFETWADVSPLSFTEVGMTQNPDIVVDWRPANDPDHSMVGGVLAHADFPPGCGVVTNTLPKPVHFDDSEHQWVVGAQAGAFDIETVALHEIGHIIGLQHSGVAGSVMFPSVSANSTKRALTADDLGGVRALYPPSQLAAGAYTVRHKSSRRFMDAHEAGANDFSVVTRTAQNNDTQRWVMNPIGRVVTIRQKSNGRFMDAHESGNDFSVVTRTAQDNNTQRWVLMPDPSGSGTFTAQQLSTGRFMDAHEAGANDFSVVTRTAQNNDTQRWVLTPSGDHVFKLRQKSSGRFLDAHEAGNDFSVVTRTAQNNDTQRWVFGDIGTVYTIQQKSNGRFMDAHEAGNDFSVVTRTAQNNDTQRWVLIPSAEGSFTVHQLSNGRFMDAHENSGNDFSVVTRTNQNNNTQRWNFNRA